MAVMVVVMVMWFSQARRSLRTKGLGPKSKVLAA